MTSTEWLKLNRCPWCRYRKRKACGCKVSKTYDGWRCYGYRCDEEKEGERMTDNRATELREKLDALGIGHFDYDKGGRTQTMWESPDGKRHFTYETSDNPAKTARLVIAWHPTPEQAIAATLGRPKVKKVRGMTYDEHGCEVYFLACSGCGDWVDGDLDCIGEYDGPNFCHNCGGEFDGPLMCKVCGELADMEFGDMCAECYWGEGDGHNER